MFQMSTLDRNTLSSIPVIFPFWTGPFSVTFLIFLCDELWFAKWPWLPSLSSRLLLGLKQSSSLETQALKSQLWPYPMWLHKVSCLLWVYEALWFSLLNRWSKHESRPLPLLPTILQLPVVDCPQTLPHPLLCNPPRQKPWTKFTKNVKDILGNQPVNLVVGDAPLNWTSPFPVNILILSGA